MASAFLELDRISLALGSKRLLDSISFTLSGGGYTVVLGPNGAGKSTLLKCLVGIIGDYTGSIRLEGRDLRKIKRKSLARRIAYLQQITTEGFAFTVRQIVETGRYPYLGSLSPVGEADREIVEQSMAELGVDSFADRNIETLSGGERQKVLLAAALAQEPELLLLDEPTTFLDYRHQREIGETLARLHRERNVSILEITHDANRALDCAEQVVAMKSGRVLWTGPVEGLRDTLLLREIYDVPFEFDGSHVRLARL